MFKAKFEYICVIEKDHISIINTEDKIIEERLDIHDLSRIHTRFPEILASEFILVAEKPPSKNAKAPNYLKRYI